VKWRSHLPLVLSALSVAWCVLAGLKIWFTPIAWSGIDGNGVRMLRTETLSETSYLGSAPLVAPVVIAVVATCAASQGAPVVVGIAAVLLAAFSFITGFSIGSAYHMPAGVLMLAAFLTAIRAAQPAAR